MDVPPSDAAGFLVAPSPANISEMDLDMRDAAAAMTNSINVVNLEMERNVQAMAAVQVVAAMAAAEHQQAQAQLQLAAVAAFSALPVVFETVTSVMAVAQQQLEIERQIQETIVCSEQPLKSILRSHPVTISSDNYDIEAIHRTLDQLDQLILACSNSPDGNKGRAPGFWTMHQLATTQGGPWVSSTVLLAYQTMLCTPRPDEHRDLPLPSPIAAKRAYVQVRDSIQSRLDYLITQKHQQGEEFEPYCSCISEWWSGQVAVRQIINQSMEQVMVEEASEYLIGNRNFHVPTWNASYAPNNASPDDLATKDYPLPSYTSPILLVSNRDHYMGLLVRALLAAQHSVFISTSYLFCQDPAHLYVLFDVLPAIARERSIQIFFLMDLFVFESNMLSSPFRVVQQQSLITSTKEESECGSGITPTSFLEHLPEDCPTRTARTFDSVYDAFDALVHSDIQVRFFCARDSSSGYRIKNHTKGIVIDDQWAIFGGSNLTPTVKSATGDLDCVVTGEAAQAVGDSFWKLWLAMDEDNAGCGSRKQTTAPVNPELASLSKTEDTGAVPDCTFSILQSSPSSAGEDSIYRVVLEHIESAQDSITVSMGHCCYPQSFVDALARAANRGVRKIELLVNSYHSNDLRGGQQDLFVSIRPILEQVPTARVYATCCREQEDGVRRPPFLHGKYVIVDGSWMAVGSWNLWNRSSFYELELEAFVESSKVASLLQTKFDHDCAKDAVQVALQDCFPGQKFCPKGCQLCRGFGPLLQIIEE